MIFYTADLHLSHKNIIRLCNRPFSSVEEMDAALIANWNAVVGAEDTVYILGDFSFRSPTSMKSVLKRLAHDSIHIHGHIHNNTDGIAFSTLKDMPAYNAGVEVNDYFPVTLERLKANKTKFYEAHQIASQGGGNE